MRRKSVESKSWTVLVEKIASVVVNISDVQVNDGHFATQELVPDSTKHYDNRFDFKSPLAVQFAV
jgi:hypothetical protein